MKEGACVPEELRFYLEFSFIYNLKPPAWFIKKLARLLASGASFWQSQFSSFIMNLRTSSFNFACFQLIYPSEMEADYLQGNNQTVKPQSVYVARFFLAPRSSEKQKCKVLWFDASLVFPTTRNPDSECSAVNTKNLLFQTQQCVPVTKGANIEPYKIECRPAFLDTSWLRVYLGSRCPRTWW